MSATPAKPHRRWIVAAALVLVALLVGFAAVNVQAEDDAVASVNGRFQSRSELSAAFTRSYLDDVAQRERSNAERVLAGETVAQADFEGVAQALGFQAAVLLDGSGHLLQVWPAKPEIIGKDMTVDYPHLRAAVAGDVAVSDVVSSAAAGDPVSAVAVPYDTPYGRRVISGAFLTSATPLDAYFKSLLAVRGSQTFLVDGNGRLLTTAGPAATAPELADRRTGIEEHDGVTYARAAVPGTSWLVVFSAPTDELQQAVNVRSWQPWALWAALAIAGIVVIALMAGIARARAAAAELARTDALTGLRNRRGVLEALEVVTAHATRFGEPLAAMLVDLDSFKLVNDTQGHEAGDRVLHVAATAMLTGTRDADVCGRWGGEEFVILLPGAALEGAVGVAERVRAAIFAASGVTASVGIGLFDPTDPEQMLTDADLALYSAKHNGRDRVEHRTRTFA